MNLQRLLSVMNLRRLMIIISLPVTLTNLPRFTMVIAHFYFIIYSVHFVMHSSCLVVYHVFSIYSMLLAFIACNVSSAVPI